MLIGLGSKLPLYAFEKSNKLVCEDVSVCSENEESPVDFLNSLLLGEVIIN